jgi:hypothetical protein
VSSSDWIALVSLIVALAALGIAVYAISRANATASAATLISLNEAFRQRWEQCLPKLQGQDASYEIAELLNLLEIACAIYLERSVTGNSRELLVEYLNALLSLVVREPAISDRVPQLLENRSTFAFIRKFLRKKRSVISVTIPPAWYEL